VLAPTTIAECFWKTVEAFNLAEKYQLPVYLTADLSMAVTEQTFTPDTFDMDEVEIDRGFVVDETTIDDHMSESGGFQPHEITDDGISPRAFPGTADGAHMSTGLEHDEQGRRTEDTGMRVEQVDKRNRKVDTAEEREDWSPREFGDADADTLVISWGNERERSPRRSISSPTRGRRAGAFRAVHLPAPDLSEDVEAAENVIVVECNERGQFANLIEHDVLARVDRINKYNGVRFKADELADDIKETLAAGWRRNQ